VTRTKPNEKRLPQLEPRLIERPRLLEKLDNCDARIIALIAPAGSGKTTLARQWVTARNVNHAWYSVGPEGFDVAAVAARVATTVSTILPGASERMLTRLSVSTDPEAEAGLLAEFLAREIESWPAGARFVLDDYQALAVSAACERFVETLVHETPLRLLVASRSRPGWARSRLRLYGDLFEIGREELQMTPEEAGDVLAPIADEERRAQLVSLCHGWPAVLGLAAHSRSPAPPQDVLLEGLYDYFAEELFRSAPPDLQRLLCQISAVPRLTGDLLERLGGEASLELAAEAERAGFFHHGEERGERSLHPLLRAFLEHRLDDRPDRIELVNDLAEALLARERWDDVWQLIQNRSRPDLLPRLIESSLPTLLDGSRIPALESWIAYGHEHGVVSPLLDLAEAEVSFLAGEHTKAYALALQATHHFGDSSPLRWRAHAIAGRSAHFLDRLDIALDHLHDARSVAPDHQAIEHCLWTEFLCSYELELDNCASILDKLKSLQGGRLETLVRIAQGELFLNRIVGALPPYHPFLESTITILDRVHPQVRASFSATYCDHLNSLARYADADSTLSEISSFLCDFKLTFGLPVIYCTRASSAIGLRRYRHAELLLDAAESSIDTPNISMYSYVWLLRDIVELLKTKQLAYASTSHNTDAAPCFWQGLALGVRALKSVCGNELNAALAYSAQADKMTRNSETRVLTAMVRAIVAIRSGSPNAVSVIQDALALAEKYEQWNPAVWAYRACPDLLVHIARETPIALQIAPILASARDGSLAERYGISLPTTRPSQFGGEESLTQREREILYLVAEGLTNNEIGDKAYISEVTVKVHLRHIYEKLGVRNRTEAALYAVYPD
jgi:LuxR family maltose regulon positive regulatory protein